MFTAKNNNINNNHDNNRNILYDFYTVQSTAYQCLENVFNVSKLIFMQTIYEQMVIMMSKYGKLYLVFQVDNINKINCNN